MACQDYFNSHRWIHLVVKSGSEVREIIEDRRDELRFNNRGKFKRQKLLEFFEYKEAKLKRLDTYVLLEIALQLFIVTFISALFWDWFGFLLWLATLIVGYLRREKKLERSGQKIDQEIAPAVRKFAAENADFMLALGKIDPETAMACDLLMQKYGGGDQELVVCSA